MFLFIYRKETRQRIKYVQFKKILNENKKVKCDKVFDILQYNAIAKLSSDVN